MPGTIPAAMVDSLHDRVAGVSRLRLLIENAEGRQSLTDELVDRLKKLIENETEAAIITIEGGVDSFCEGFDLNSVIGTSVVEDMPDPFSEVLAAIDRAPQIVIALIDGEALGGGVGLAAAADLVIASPRARFVLPETLMGLIPATIFPYVARRIGVSRARLLSLGSRPLAPAQALEFGLVDEIADDLSVALYHHVKRFAKMDRRALAAMKTLVATHFPPPRDYNAEAALRFRQLAMSEETRARIARFVQGDSPWENGAA